MNLKPPPWPGTPQQRQDASEDALQRAAAAIQANRAADAERIAGEVLKANAGNQRAMLLLGTALSMQNRFKEAIAPLERAARQARDPAVETQLAIALGRLGRNDEAIERLQRATKRKPPFPPAFLEFGTLLSSLDRTGEAIDALQRGLAAAPDSTDLWVELGSAYARRNDHAAAREAYERALAITPSHRTALVGIAEARRNAGDYERAAEAFRQVLAIAPDHADARLGLGVCLLELGLAEPGFNSLRMAVNAGPRIYGNALFALCATGRGRLWLRPSAAKKFLRGEKS